MEYRDDARLDQSRISSSGGGRHGGRGGIATESGARGPSAMRKYWAQKCFASGDSTVCDTFATGNFGG